MSRIKYELKGVSFYAENERGKINDFLLTYLPKFEKALHAFIKNLI